MEKNIDHGNSCSRKNRNLKINLPKINKENINSLNRSNGSYIPSPEKILELKKAYFQYKSNARILEQSPYCSTQNKKQILSLIKEGKFS